MIQQTQRRLDPRWFQILFQLSFLTYGICFLHWQPQPLHYAISFGGCVLATWLFESMRQSAWINVRNAQFLSAAHSACISAAGLSLLLKTNHWTISVMAVVLTIASKYLLRVGSKHIFNPAAFGIVATILISGQAWISPGQWGTAAVLFFAIATLGTIVVTRVQKLDVSLAFILTYAGLLFWRQILVLGWPMDFFVHSVSTGGLLLFTFFMISDPRTAPNHPVARVTWAMLIAAVAFYCSAFKWMNSTPVFALVALAPLVPVLDKMLTSKAFSWSDAKASDTWLGRAFRHAAVSRSIAMLLLAVMMGYEALAFCGFYVSKADGTLKNKTSQVILVRDGNKNVITMYNDFKGDTKDFAMVVPVPTVLKKSDIKVVDPALFKTLNEYSQPRLVEYFDDNPCEPRIQYDMMAAAPAGSAMPMRNKRAAAKDDEQKVRIEAQYLVGEYDILILSATESTALKTWLSTNGYKMPPNAEEVLDPYIKSNLKFFVVKVNEAEKAKLANDFLRPIQIAYASPKFMLPIRLGMANADGDQDLIVYAFTKKGRVELTNYRTVSAPTGDQVPLFVNDNFSAFYANLFNHQWQKEGKSIGMLEYAWDVSPRNYVKCDPCVATAPAQQDLVNAGVWWMTPRYADYEDEGYDPQSASVFFTRLHVRYNRRSFPQDLMFQLTPNSENFQARYVITHPATGDLSCAAGQQYRKTLQARRRKESANLRALTGKTLADWDDEVGVALPTDNMGIDSYAGISQGEDGSVVTIVVRIGLSILQPNS